MGVSVVVWLVWVAVWLSLAVTAASMAEHRDQPPALWFVLGLCFPVLALVVLAVCFQPRDVRHPSGSTVADAVGRNPVARALAVRPGSSAHQLEQVLSSPPKTVLRDLRDLRRLGLADRDDTGRWSLTTDGIDALRSGDAAGASEV
jgi:hypothetical protein